MAAWPNLEWQCEIRLNLFGADLNSSTPGQKQGWWFFYFIFQLVVTPYSPNWAPMCMYLYLNVSLCFMLGCSDPAPQQTSIKTHKHSL